MLFRSTFVVPSEALPGRWTLLEREGRRYRLQLGRGMEARIADRTQVVSVAAGAPRAVPLPEAAHGRVVVGDVVLLFQLVPQPPVRPRPQLPASLRASFWTRLDRPFAVVALLSPLAHLWLVIYLRRVDWPRLPNIEPIEEGLSLRATGASFLGRSPGRELPRRSVRRQSFA